MQRHRGDQYGVPVVEDIWESLEQGSSKGEAHIILVFAFFNVINEHDALGRRRLRFSATSFGVRVLLDKTMDVFGKCGSTLMNCGIYHRICDPGNNAECIMYRYRCLYGKLSFHPLLPRYFALLKILSAASRKFS